MSPEGADPLDLAGDLLARDLAGEDVGNELAALPAELRAQLAAALEAQRACVGPRRDLAPRAAGEDGLFGSYRILRMLGRGGQGTIYLAEDAGSGRRVALKVLDPFHSVSGERLARLHREARLASRLDHPGICTVFETGLVAGRAFIAMSYVEGETLARALERQRGLPPDTTRWLGLLEQAATTLHVAHEAGIVHRDLKPANLMLTPDGGVVILDFGLAGDEVHEHGSLTASDATFGTPAYMSPEQISGAGRRPDRRTDIWSLGAILHEAVTGSRPFARSDRESLYHSILTEEPTDPLLLNPRLSGHVRVVLQRALAKRPADRYRTALELAEDLRALRVGLPTRARVPGTGRRAWRWLQRNPRLGAAFAGAFLFLAVGLGATLCLLAQTRRERDRATRALASERAALLRSESLTLLARSQVEANRDPARALEMALEGAEHAPLPLAQDTILKLLDRADLDRVLTGHEGPVLDAAFSPDGLRAATASADGTARVWDVHSGRVLAVHRLAAAPRAGGLPAGAAADSEHGAARAVAWSRDGKAVAAAGDDGIVYLFAAEGELLTGSFAAHAAAVSSLAFHPREGLLLTASADGSAVLWDAKTGAAKARFEPHGGPLTRAAFDRSGELVVTASADGTARVWSATGVALAVLDHGRRGLRDACLDADGKRVLTACDDNTAWLWELSGRNVIGRFRGNESVVTSVAFDPAGAGFATGSCDRTVRIWEHGSEALPRPLTGHRKAVNRIAFSPAGTSLISASGDATARVWLTRPRAELAVLPHGSWATTSAAFSHDGSMVATTCELSSTRIWSLENGRVLRDLRGHDAIVTSACFSHDDLWLATAASDGTARVFEVATGRTVHVLPLGAAGARTRLRAEWSPLGDLLLVTAASGAAAIFDARTGALRQRIEGLAPFHATGSVTRSGFSPDGRLVATVPRSGGESEAVVWDVATGGVVTRLAGHGGVIYSLAFDPEGRRVVTTSYDRTARIWDLAAPAAPVTLSGHEGGVLAGSFDRTGTRLVTCGMDGTARTWDVASARQTRVFRGHDDLIYCAAFSPDGKSVVTGSWDGTAALWDCATGERQLVQEAHRRPVLSACFSPDGSSVLSAGLDGCARVWPTDPLALARRLCTPPGPPPIEPPPIEAVR